MTAARPTAAPPSFPYLGHRTLAEVERDERWAATRAAAGPIRKEPRHGR